jgi:3-deoxy-D-manno-octulosonic-acid transferase
LPLSRQVVPGSRRDILGVLLLYRALAALALTAYAPFAFLRSLTGGRRLGDVRGRCGFADWPDLEGGVWIHAVSVGEVGVARNLLPELRRRWPHARLGVSASTAAGRELAERTFAREAAVYAFPFDFAGPVEKALAATRPGMIILTETEIWPLFIERAARRGIPVALVNGRISERSFARYRIAGGFIAKTLARLSIATMQSKEDAGRLEALGAPSERVRAFGNLKYDLPAPPVFADGERLAAAAGGRPVVVAGSTGEGEEALVLDAWRDLAPRPLLVLAPRRPERFDEVARLVESRGLRLQRRSTLDPRPSTRDFLPDVYLLDSIGELASVYRGASLAFAGGSLVPSGGQSPIEAWAAGVPVVAGPHMENFREVARQGEALGILQRAGTPESLGRLFADALARPSETGRRGAEAARFVAGSRGAAAATADALHALAPALGDGRGSAS